MCHPTYGWAAIAVGMLAIAKYSFSSWTWLRPAFLPMGGKGKD